VKRFGIRCTGFVQYLLHFMKLLTDIKSLNCPRSILFPQLRFALRFASHSSFSGTSKMPSPELLRAAKRHVKPLTSNKQVKKLQEKVAKVTNSLKKAFVTPLPSNKQVKKLQAKALKVVKSLKKASNKQVKNLQEKTAETKVTLEKTYWTHANTGRYQRATICDHRICEAGLRWMVLNQHMRLYQKTSGRKSEKDIYYTFSRKTNRYTQFNIP